jgi:phospholipase C
VQQIEHVVVLALENRSFDHMLGYLPHPDPAFDGLLAGGPYTNPGWAGGAPVAVSPDAKVVLPVGPDHSHDAAMEQLATGPGVDAPTNRGFVTSYERICRGLSPPAFGGLLAPLLDWWRARSPAPAAIRDRGPLVMRCQSPGQVPVLAELATQFAVFTRWFCSVPGETWPNRNFLHAATSDGETDIDPRFYTNPTIFELLERHGHSWHIYYDDTPQVWAFVHLWDTPERHANWFEFAPAFAQHVAAGQLPNYSFIEPNHRPALHTLDHDPVVGSPDVSNNQHPGNNLVGDASYDSFPATVPSDFTRGDALIASVYQALRSNPELFACTLLLVTYDEHGGLYDHVPPPTGVPNPGYSPTLLRRFLRTIYHRKAAAFDFSMLGPRVPAVLISPYVEAGTVSTDVHDHASVPATLRALFAPAARPLTARDAWARPFHQLAARDTPRANLPDLSHALPTAVPPPQAGTRWPALGGSLPRHYEPFVDLADNVRRQLAARGAPEAAPAPGLPALERARQATVAFSAEAYRSRQHRGRP